MMRIKKFTGPSIARSMELAKREMGEDALILQTLRRRKGVEHVVEIVAANNRAARTAGNLGSAGAGAGGAAAAGKITGPQVPGGEAGALDLGVMRDLEEIEAQLGAVLARLAPPEWNHRRKRLCDLRVNLHNAGLDPGLIQKKMLAREPDPGTSFESYLEDVLGDVPLEAPEERVSAFVGASGSGKTTALLKVAVCVLGGRGVTPRVLFYGPSGAAGARELAASCKRLGLKFKGVSDAAELAREVRKSGNRPVLIDTPGIARLGEDRLESLAALTQSVEGAAIRLVVDSAMDAANITAIASCIPAPARVSLVLTKLDEATRIGGAISAAIRERIPVAYLTGGEEVDSGVFVPDRSLLYERVLESVAGTGTDGN